MNFVNICLLTVLLMVLSTIQATSQDEFEGFMKLIDEQRAEENNVEHDEFDFFKKEVYGKDRHGRPFIKCADHNSTSTKRVRNVRCPILGKSDRPGCFALFDKNSNQVIQGCYNYQKEIAELCEASPACTFPNSAGETVFFCCCVGDRCNAQENVLWNGSTMEKELEILFNKNQ